MPNLVDRFVDLSRSMAIAKKRSRKLKAMAPFSLVALAARWRSRATALRRLYAPVVERTSADNIFHCCVHKTGSVWVKSLLVDLMTYRYCGLSHYHYQSRMMSGRDPRPVSERSFDDPFPEGTIVSPLYITFDNFAAMPKAGSYRAFFVARDPRDILISWYFSAKVSHVLQGTLVEIRPRLNQLSLAEGLLFSIDHLAEYGLFEALDSWSDAEARDPDVLVVRYEELIGSRGRHSYRRVFDHLDIRMPDPVLRELLESYSFERVTGRKRGEERADDQMRKGKAGDWKNYFDDRTASRFEAVVGDLPARLGYD